MGAAAEVVAGSGVAVAERAGVRDGGVECCGRPERLGVSRPTVGKWRSRFVEARLDGFVDHSHPGRPATVTVDQVEEVVVATLESTPV